MKSVSNQEHALNLLLEKNENQILNELTLINADKNSCLFKINELQNKLKNNPSPAQLNQNFNSFALSNYYQFHSSIENSIIALETELKNINDKLQKIQHALSKINYQQDMFSSYYHKIKQQNKILNEKKIESAIHDQYIHVNKFLKIHQK